MTSLSAKEKEFYQERRRNLRITATEIAANGQNSGGGTVSGDKGLWRLLVSGGTQRQRASRVRGSSHE